MQERSMSQEGMIQPGMGELGSEEQRTQMRERAREVGNRAGEYVDKTTTSLGRRIETAADKLATRAESASGGLAKMGRYLQEADPQRMGQDITRFVKDHPAAALATGFGLGLLIGRALAR